MSLMRLARLLALSLALLGLQGLLASAAVALPDGKREEGSPLERAREEAGLERKRPQSRFELPQAELRVTAERLAADGQEIAFRVALDRAVSSGSLRLTLPARWLQTAPSGLRYAQLPRAEGARLERSGRVVRASVRDALAGDEVAVTVEDVGIPAGTYEIPYEWRSPRGSQSGTAKVVLYAPTREAGPENPWARLSSPGAEFNSTNDALEQSETFIAVSPSDDDRIAVGINGGSSMSAWVSNNRGASFTKSTLSNFFDAPGEAGAEPGEVCCDPMFAADTLGNIWFGGLSTNFGAGTTSRIVVARIPAGGSSLPSTTVGLPVRTAGIQDKPMMTIDNSPSSPFRGRLYVVWNEPDGGGGINVVISQCDTRTGTARLPAASRCDNADNWTQPVTVEPNGNYIYADVAVGPDGRVYVVWWDFSSDNRIEGKICNPSSQNCASASGWSGAESAIAGLNNTGGPVPFACPIIAQPGGRAGPSPSVEVALDTGRVFVAWGDITGSGTTRCADDGDPFAPQPLATNRTWDSYVDSAVGALPSGANDMPLYVDGSDSSALDNSDDWFPWIAVDQTTGIAWAGFYSTRDDTTEQTTQFYARSVSATGTTLGSLRRVSDTQQDPAQAPNATGSDYSNNLPCCNFGNDYGDYSGIDATNGAAFPLWTDNSAGTGGDGEAFVFRGTGAFLQLALGTAGATATEAAGADGDGQVEPGEPITLTVPVRNPGAVGATGVQGTLLPGPVPGLSVTQGSSNYPDIAAGGTQTNTTAFAATLPPVGTVACGQAVDFQLGLDTNTEHEDVFFTVPVSCAVPPPPPPPPGPPPPPVAPPPPPVAPPPPPAEELTLRVSVPSRRSFATAFFQGIRATATCNKACRLVAELQLDARTAKKLRLKRTIARARSSLARPGRRSITVKIPRRTQRVLRTVRSVPLTLRVVASDDDERKVVRKKVTLKR